MNEVKYTSQKTVWLSQKKLAFEWETALGKQFPWGYQEIGKKKVVVIAEEGKDLFFIDKGEEGGYYKDPLCWFCQNSINLGRLGHAPTCLLGKYILDVTICKDFIPGPCFGENKDSDVGERRIIAEKILPQIEWQNCTECRFFNTEKACKIVKDDEGGVVIENPAERFCEILHRLREPSYSRTCKHFEVSNDPCGLNIYERRKKALNDYVNSLTVLEHQKALNK